MLRTIKTFAGKTASNSEAGDLNRFLCDVLVEVAAENYRQTMYELMALTTKGDAGRQFDLAPPLRANERVMSGLFATAILKALLRSRTEVRIDRLEQALTLDALNEADAPSEGSEVSPSMKHGHVDYLAWYGSRVIGIELKMAGMNCERPAPTRPIIRGWRKAVEQANTVQSCLRDRQKEDRARYPNPVSLALMVLVGRRNAGIESIDEMNHSIDDMEQSAIDMAATRQRGRCSGLNLNQPASSKAGAVHLADKQPE
ncbi:hypothetical protein ACS15_2220 [Ralstonia insidiosa]|uniref:Uncharacterized protein n=1 Tax=Ralstonia insidiosa TaxID=190721 RepID=A0AAC9BDW0_9RALS|nr:MULTISPECIES: hypothetical protein [Ralstonia]ANH72323.1 hypothetical protein ACS15_2220 [Ralstonia insidiosa]EPX98401.1 hypothetical protein C404_08400 [Ralstonia sp. AU12-08]